MNDHDDSNLICIGEQSKKYLREIAGWGKLFAILGFIKFGFLLLYSFVFPLIADKIEAHFQYDLPVIGITIFFLVMATIVFFPSNYLYRFARCTKKALNQDNQDIIRHAFESLKDYYRYMGILVIIMLCMYPIAIVAAIIIY